MLIDLLVDRGQQRRAECDQRVVDAVFHCKQRALQFDLIGFQSGLVVSVRDQCFSDVRQLHLRDGLRLLEPGNFFLQAIDLLFEFAERGFLSSLLVDSGLRGLPQPIARVLPRFLDRRYRAFIQAKADEVGEFRLRACHGNSLIWLI